MTWLILLPWLALTAHTAVNATLLRRLTPPDSARIKREKAARRAPTANAAQPPPDPARTKPEKTAILLPLRNEAGRLTPCLESLLAQRGVPDLSIFVLDDGSTDGTADVVRAIAGDKVHLLTGEPLPPGWLGKPHACQQLAEAARDATLLSFVDADVVLAPDAIAAATALLRGVDVTLLSPYPEITGTGRRLIQPLLQWSWLTFLPLRAMERSRRPALAAAGGQWLLVDRAGYQRAGGHAAVRAEVLEDVALARQVKRAGGRIALADGSTHATCRMYESWRELTDGYTKSLWATPAGTVVVILLLLYVVPVAAAPILAVTGATAPALIALAAYVLSVIGRAIAARVTGGRAWPDAVAHPVSIVLFAWLATRSVHLHRRGRLVWRGRSL